MALYILITLGTVALSLLVVPYEKITTYEINRKQAVCRVSVAAIFTVLFLLSAFRMEVGNDYKNYAITCHEVWVNGYVVTEPGFNWLVKGIYTLAGGENYVAVFAVFAFFTLALFLTVFRKYSQSFFLSFMMFMTLGLYFRTFNTVRYYFVLAVALYSLVLLTKSKHFAFLALIVMASFFHKSVLFVIPAYYMAYFIHKKYHYLLLGIGSVCLLLGKKIVMQVAVKLYPSYQNTEYLEQSATVSEQLPGMFLALLVLLMSVFSYKEQIKENREYRICFNLNLMALLLMTCGYYIPLLSRFTYYLTISHLLLVPAVIMNSRDRKKQTALTCVLLAVCILYFLLFLTMAKEPGIRVLPYHTWIMDGMKEYHYANEIL